MGGLWSGDLVKLTKEQAEQCVEMYDRGMPLVQIAKYFKVTRQSMWSLVRRRTTMRPQHPQGKANHFYRGTRIDQRARHTVERAILRGIISRQDKCEQCGLGGKRKNGAALIYAHHDDYNKPLEVRWLCHRCHYAWHKEHRAKSLNVPVPSKTRLTGTEKNRRRRQQVPAATGCLAMFRLI